MTISILYVVNEARVFLSHRLPVARAAAKVGYEVHVAAPPDENAQRRIESEGFIFHAITLTRRGVNPLVEWKGLLSIFRLYRRLKPTLIHHVTTKPVIYGGVAARLAGMSAVISAITGLGYVFIAQGNKARLLRDVVLFLFRLALGHRNTWVIFQNPEDQQLLQQFGVVTPHQAVLIRGSGVDMEEFCPSPEPLGVPVVVLASRMLWDKGIGEFVEAARNLKAKGTAARFVLVGDPDTGNPATIPREQLQAWNSDGVVEWWGRREDMPEIFAKAHIVCLPSYREGVPRVLIEASACGIPIVTTDVPGCREIVKNEVNGLLVPMRDAAALEEALHRLIGDAELRRSMGLRGREVAIAEFSAEHVAAETLLIYRQALSAI